MSPAVLATHAWSLQAQSRPYAPRRFRGSWGRSYRMTLGWKVGWNFSESFGARGTWYSR